jgi:hypothetical protein
MNFHLVALIASDRADAWRRQARDARLLGLGRLAPEKQLQNEKQRQNSVELQQLDPAELGLIRLTLGRLLPNQWRANEAQPSCAC